MKIAVVLAGQYRGNNDMVSLHKENIGDYDTYVACLEKYLPNWLSSNWFPKGIFNVPFVEFQKTLWAQYRNSCEADESGFWQYWNLKYVLKEVPKDYDFYIKSRNDLVIESKLNLDFSKLRDDTYYYSERHFNGYWPHMNDQFWIGSSKIVNLISRFVDDFYLTPGSESVGKSNEHMLRWWILSNGFRIEPFQNFLYSKNHNGITQSSGDVNKFFLE